MIDVAGYIAFGRLVFRPRGSVTVVEVDLCETSDVKDSSILNSLSISADNGIFPFKIVGAEVAL